MGSVVKSGSCPLGGNPKALRIGSIAVGRARVDCYVLDGGDRVIGLRGAVQCIAGPDPKVKESPANTGLHRLIEEDLILTEVRTFLHPEDRTVTTGITARGLLDICRAFLLTLAERKEVTSDQHAMANRCAALLDRCADAGLVALIDDATGYAKFG